MTDSNVLVAKSYGGHAINDGAVYVTLIQGHDQILARFTSKAVETDVPAKFPTFAFGQPQSRQLSLTITVQQHTQTNYEALVGYFDQALGQQYLVCTDDNGVDRRMLCYAEDYQWISPVTYKVALRASTGVWEKVSQETATLTVTSSGQTTTVTNSGNTRVYPSFTVTPNSPKPSLYAQHKRRRITIANRSEFPLTDPVGDGYPIDVTDGGLNTSVLELVNDLSDLRLVLNSVEQNRYPYPDGAVSASTKIWANLSFRPRLKATLSASITAGATDLSVNNPEYLGGWPSVGFVLIDDECVQYTGRTQTSLSGLRRGARGTVAASHSPTSIYWVEHPYLDLIHAYSGLPTDVPEPSDRSPVIDLNQSQNSLHVWSSATDVFFNDNDRRSRAWQRQFSDDIAPTGDVITSTASGHVRLYASTGMRFEDLLPSAGKPRFNNAVMDFPVPVAAASNAVVLDYNTQQTMLLQAYVLDLDGNESRLLSRFYSSATQTGTTLSTGDNLSRIRFNGRAACVAGDLNTADLFGWTGGLSNSIQVAIHKDGSVEIPKYSGGVIIVSPNQPNLDNNPIQYFLQVERPPWFHFTLERTTTIAGLVIFTDSNVPTFGAIYTRNGLNPDKFIGSGVFAGVTSASLNSAILATDESDGITLPAGDYSFAHYVGAFKYLATSYTHETRTEPNMYFGYDPDPDQLFNQGNLNDSAISTIQSFTDLHQDEFQFSPLFGILSRVNEAQSDAPKQTGDTIQIDNIFTSLDSSFTPKIVVADESDMYLADFRIANENTGDYIDVFFPMSLAQSVTIDCATRTITDNETGLPIPFAITASNPTEWIYFQAGGNVLSYTEPGVANTTLAVSYRSRWL